MCIRDRGDPLEIIGYGENIKTVATEIHVFNNPVPECSAGMHVGILARGMKPNSISRGMMAALPGSVSQSDNYEASIYMLKHEEGGKKKPIT